MPAPAETFFSKPLIGILSAVAGNIVISVALNVQRYAHLRLKPSSQPPSSADPERRYLRSSWWWLGVLLMTIGEAGNFIAYGFAPASVVSPLGVLALVSNCVIAPTFFGERISPRNILGVAVTVVGILFIITSVSPGAAETPTGLVTGPYTINGGPHDFLMITISRLSFRVYLICVTALIAGLLVLRQKAETTARTSTTYLFSNLGLVALVGAFTALSTKGLSGLLNNSFPQAFADPLTYILLLVLVITAVVQVLFLNAALEVFNATMVLPVHFVLFTISVIVGSAITFQEFKNSDATHLALFVIGCGFTFIGVWLITSSPGDGNGIRELTVTPKPIPTLITPDLHESSASETQLLLPCSFERKHGGIRSGAITAPFSVRPVLAKSYSYTHEGTDGGPLLSVTSRDRSASRTSASVPQHSILLDGNQLDHYKTTFTSSGFFIGTVLQTKRSLNFIYNNTLHSGDGHDIPPSEAIPEV
jgi:drug/metabolite transporter (DMT)-like permease